jgi:DNA-binding response OmpR family regulator
MGRRILVVEDDGAIRELIAAILRAAGFTVETAADGQAMAHALGKALEGPAFDLLLLDLNLPDGDGLDLARSLRARSRMGIIIVSERDAPDDRADGLEIGADDYVTKPFFPRELVARVKNVLDRTAAPELPFSDGAETIGPWVLDRDNRRVVALDDGRDAGLTRAEFDLLVALAAHPGDLLSRDDLAKYIPDRRAEGAGESGRAVDILVSRLRKKLGDDRDGSRMIETVRGHGYRFAVAPRR